MATYTAFGVNGNGATGPSAGFNDSGSWLNGLLFTVTSSGYQVSGYGIWITNDGNMNTNLTFALWQATGFATGTLIAGSSATVSTLTPGTWQYTSLATPIALTANTVYKLVSCSGTGFWLPLQSNYFGTGDPYVNGVVNGPLTVFSSSSGDGGTLPDMYNDVQGTFTGQPSNDPTAVYPVTAFTAFNPWIDVQITPAGTNSSPEYAASYDIIAGGSGSWVNPANAEGAPDSSYATWTAP